MRIAPLTLVLEGPDCAGKTTLADTLQKYFIGASMACSRAAFGPPPPGAGQTETFWYLAKTLMPPCDEEDSIRIVDRSYPSNFVYGGVMLNQVVMSGKNLRLLDDLLVQQNGLFIFCDRANDKLTDAWLGRRNQEMVKGESDYLRIIDTYRLFFGNKGRAPLTLAPVLNYDCDMTGSTERLITKIMQHMNRIGL